MPCESPGRGPEQTTKDQLNERTDQLCTTLRLIEGRYPHLLKELPEPLQRWWDKHCDKDLRQCTKVAREALERVSQVSGNGLGELRRDEMEAMARLIELAHRAR